MVGRKALTAGSAVLVVVVAAVSSYAVSGDASQATASARATPANSGASDAHEQPGFLDLRSAHVRVGAEKVSVRLTTHDDWRPAWLLQCREAFFAVGWLEDQVQVDVGKREGRPLQAIVKRADATGTDVVGRVRAYHRNSRTVMFAFSAGKLESSDGKWFAFSTSPRDSGCKEQWYGDRIPDVGSIVP